MSYHFATFKYALALSGGACIRLTILLDLVAQYPVAPISIDAYDLECSVSCGLNNVTSLQAVLFAEVKEDALALFL
jgi:hypothetical protein